jgi:hypothetical protein
MTGFDALTPPSPRLLGPTPLNEKPAPVLPAGAAVAPAAAAEMAPADESFATSPGKANFAPKGDVHFGDKSPDAVPVSAGDKKIPDFVKEIMKKKEQAASYRVGQDQSKDRLDQRVADPNLSLPEAVKGAQDALDQLTLPPCRTPRGSAADGSPDGQIVGSAKTRSGCLFTGTLFQTGSGPRR